VCIAFAPRLSCVHVGCLGFASMIAGIFLIRYGVGITPGVLFCMTWQWSLGVIFNMHLAMGLRDFMMGSASVSRGIVMMGVSSITLCSASRAFHWTASSTLCSSWIGGGVSRSWICMPRSLSKHLPLGVVFASAVCLANLSVRARRCWRGVKAGSWQCCGSNSFNQKCGKLLFLGCNNGHIDSNLVQAQYRMCLRLGMPMSRGCRHLCTPLLWIQEGQEYICSSCMRCSESHMQTLRDQYMMHTASWVCPGPGG
jgi:hypothetical protein